MSQINALPINGFTIADLALLAPGPGQFLEVGGDTEGRIDIDALAAYARLGTATESQGTLAEAALQPSDAGATGLALLAAQTAADARSAIGAMANTAPVIITNANGTAYRWPNGLQICTYTQDAAISLTQGSSTSELSRTFPASFSSTAIVFGAAGLAIAGSGNRAGSVEFSGPPWPNTSVTGWHFQISNRDSFPGTANIAKLHLLAIGNYTP